MPNHYALILQCTSSGVAERLVGVYAGLLAQATFPFRFQILINPEREEVRSIANYSVYSF